MTAWSSVAGAVEAMRRGARDYIEKPWDDERLLITVRTQIDLRRAVRRSQRLQAAHTRLQRGSVPAFIGDSRPIQQVRQTIERVAPSDAAVLITGEHGTGKEVVATWVHAMSDRKARALVTMNAGGLAEGIAESELFGHVKGAFTDARYDRIGCFEMADEGTLFLDEIANMPIRMQAKLLRVLQTGRSPARRLVAPPLRQRQDHLRDQCRPRTGDRCRPLPRGPALPAEHRGHSPAAAARSARGHRRARRAFPGALRGPVSQAALALRRGGADRAARALRGRGTCGNWRTPSSARC